MLFELVQDYLAATSVMPEDHPRRHLLTLLEEAIRRDVQFVERHPTTFFQCIWNTCWWYDCGEVERDYSNGSGTCKTGPTSDIDPLPKLSDLLKKFRSQKRRVQIDAAWIKSLRPPRDSLESGVRTFFAEQELIHSLAVSPNGTLMAIGGHGTVVIVGTADGKPMASWSDPINVIRGMDFSQNGRLIACTDAFSTFVWDLETKLLNCKLEVLRRSRLLDGNKRPGESTSEWLERLRREADSNTSEQNVRYHESPVEFTCVRFLPDNLHLVTGSADGVLRYWRTDTGTEVSAIPTGKAGIANVVVSPDGRFVAVGGTDGTISVWDASKNASLFRCQAHRSKIANSVTLAISPESDLLASGAYDGCVRIWELTSGQCVGEISGIGSIIKALRFSPDGRVLGIGCDIPGGAWFHYRADNSCRNIMQCHQTSDVAFGPNSEQLFVAEANRIISCNLQHDKEPQSVPNYSLEMAALAFSPNGRLLVTAGDNQIWFYDGRDLSLKPRQSFCRNGPLGNVSGLEFSPDGRSLVMARTSLSNGISVWNTMDGNIAWEVDWPTVLSPKRFEFTQDSSRFVCAEGGLGMAFETWTGDKVLSIKSNELSISSLRISPSGEQIICHFGNGTVRRWVLACDKYIERPLPIHEGLAKALLSKNGNQLGLLSMSGVGYVVNLMDDEMYRLKGGANDIYDLSFHPFDNGAVTLHRDGTIALLNGDPHGAEMMRFATGMRGVSSIAMSSTGEFLAASSPDGTAAVWSVDSPTPLCRLRSNGLGFVAIAFSETGRRVITQEDLGKGVSLWECTSGNPIMQTPGWWRDSSLSWHGKIRSRFQWDRSRTATSAGWCCDWLLVENGTELIIASANTGEFVGALPFETRLLERKGKEATWACAIGPRLHAFTIDRL